MQKIDSPLIHSLIPQTLIKDRGADGRGEGGGLGGRQRGEGEVGNTSQGFQPTPESPGNILHLFLNIHSSRTWNANPPPSTQIPDMFNKQTRKRLDVACATSWSRL